MKRSVGRLQSLATKLAVSATLALLVFGVSFNLINAYVELNREIQSDEKVYQRQLAAVIPLLEIATERDDNVLASQGIALLATSEIVESIRVEDDSGAVLAQLAKSRLDDSTPIVEFFAKPKSVEPIVLFKKQAYPHDSAQILGRLSISLDPRRGLIEFAERNRFFIGLGTARTLLLLGVLFFLIRYLLIVPIQQVVLGLGAASKLSVGVPTPRGHYHDEIGVLVTQINENIAQQRANLAELAANEQRFNAILEGAGDACLLFEQASGEILYANQATCNLLAHDRATLLGLKVFDITASFTMEEWVSRVSIIHSLSVHQRESTLIASDGSEIPVESTSSIIELEGKPAVLAFVRDMRTRKHLEADLAHAQKLTSLGELTGGVSHDFNNLLQLIQGALDVIEQDNDHSSTATKKSLANAKRATQQGTQLISQLLAFSRKQVLAPERVSVGQTIEENKDLLQQATGRNVNWSFSNEVAEDQVLLDRGALINALLNLVVNSVHAMPDGGQLKLTLRRLTSDELRLHLPNRLKSKEFVCLVVHDTGSGMSDEIKNRIFEPFYTTKAEGLGTGMGLASVFGFVTQSEGHIRVESELNKGSSFFIYLPVVSAKGTDTTREEGNELSAHPEGLVNPQSVSIETPSIAGASRKLVSSAHAQTGSERSNILLVDSHEELRSITQSFLETAGYSIQGVGSASAALIEVAAQDNPVTLMLTDLALPTKDEAVDLIAYCQRAHPEILIGVMSSSSKWLERTGFSAVPMRNVLPKPFSRHELIEFVRQRYAERDQSFRDGA